MINGPNTKVVIQSYTVNEVAQQIGVRLHIPVGAERITAIIAFVDTPPLVLSNPGGTNWAGKVAGKLWLQWNAPIPFFHFQTVDLADNYDEQSSFEIEDELSLIGPDFNLSGRKIEALSLNIPASLGFINGFYQDEVLKNNQVTDSYTLHLYFYYQTLEQ